MNSAVCHPVVALATRPRAGNIATKGRLTHNAAPGKVPLLRATALVNQR